MVTVSLCVKSMLSVEMNTERVGRGDTDAITVSLFECLLRLLVGRDLLEDGVAVAVGVGESVTIDRDRTKVMLLECSTDTLRLLVSPNDDTVNVNVTVDVLSRETVVVAGRVAVFIKETLRLGKVRPTLIVSENVSCEIVALFPSILNVLVDVTSLAVIVQVSVIVAVRE